MISLDFHPEPGSPTARVLDLMARNPEDGYSNSDLALKFQVKSAAWPPLLAKAKAMGLVAYTAQGEDEPKVWCAGPNLAAWMAARSATPATGGAAAPSPAGKKPSKRGGTRPLLPALDLATLKVEDRLRTAREYRGLTQGELAERAGLQPSAISHFETATRKPSFDNLLLLANTLDVTADYLLGRVAEFKKMAGADQLHRHYESLQDTDRKFADELITLLANKARDKGKK